MALAKEMPAFPEPPGSPVQVQVVAMWRRHLRGVLRI